MEKTQYVKDLLKDSKDKDPVHSPFLVKFSAVATGKNGKPYMNLVLCDKTGEIEARIWDDVNQYAGQVVRDALVLVEGKCQSYQGRKQVVIGRIQVLREDALNLKDYIPESSVDPEDLYRKLLGRMEQIQDPYYRALAESVLRDDQEIVDGFKKAPAAKSLHHAYRGGLLEHVVSVTKLLDAVSTHYGKWLDRDLMFLGGIFHDIGKIWELSYDRVTEYTTEGKLVGHLVMGVELVTEKIRELESVPGRLPGKFPQDKVLLIKHVILAHHGQLEYGSPKRPKCLEAWVVHMMDDMDSKVNSIAMFMEQDQTQGRWTGLNRQHERFFYKSDWVGEEKGDPTPS
ncbi:HD domain-containing protein [Bdellovibrionota bacterium FG-2]